MDLLFQNERYQDMLDVFEIIKQRQHQEAKFPKNVVILTFAACFKMVSISSSTVIIFLCFFFSSSSFPPPPLEVSAAKCFMC
jgi:hypothetical protein